MRPTQAHPQATSRGGREGAAACRPGYTSPTPNNFSFFENCVNAYRLPFAYHLERV